MTKLLRNLVLSASACLALAACDNGNADVTVFDSPPAVTVIRPGMATANINFNMKLKFSDGADPSLSISPLQSGQFQIKNSGGTTVQEGSLQLSGVLQEASVPVNALALGNYTVRVIAQDVAGNRDTTDVAFRVVGSIGIIGSATPGGWVTDTNMARSDSDPDLYSVRLTLTNGFAKFRADDDWATNWGAATFPEGKGTFGGNDIPVEAGTYDITLNTATGEYKFKIVQ